MPLRITNSNAYFHELRFVFDKPIEVMPAPDTVVIPLKQNIGTTSKEIVKPGTKVKIGTKIGVTDNNMSVNVHSSVAGVVTKIEPRFSPNGEKTNSVIIENNRSEEREDYSNEVTSPAEILKRLWEAGIVESDKEACPTPKKLTVSESKPIHAIILNGYDCERNLSGDYKLMLEKTREIFEGGKFILKATSAKKGYFGIQTTKPQILKKIKTIAREFGFEYFVINKKYPQLNERILIYTITGKRIPTGYSPSDMGISIHNLGTVYSIYEACKNLRPLTEKLVTVTGRVKEPKNLIVRIGTLLKDIIENCGGYTDKPAKIIFNGPLTGIAQPDENIPITKTISGILVQNEKDISLSYDYPCIKCGACISVCPVGLLPVKIADSTENRNLEEAQRLGILYCIECNSCAFVCPSKRNLAHLIKCGKLNINKKLVAFAN